MRKNKRLKCLTHACVFSVLLVHCLNTMQVIEFSKTFEEWENAREGALVKLRKIHIPYFSKYIYRGPKPKELSWKSESEYLKSECSRIDIERRISELNNEETVGRAKKLVSTGLQYMNGIGFGKDEKKAFKYFMKSAELDHGDGSYMVGYCYQHGAGVIRNEHKAFEYYSKASELGYTKGTFNVGYYYRHGIGVEKDEIKALEYYKK
ncbi:hypothetical protein C2G38_1995509, partial [Gigaspora rosea]